MSFLVTLKANSTLKLNPKTPKHILYCSLRFSIFFFQYKNWCMGCIINDHTARFTHLFLCKTAVIENACDIVILVISENNLHVHLKTPSSINLIIPKSPHFCISIFIIGIMVIKEFADSDFSNNLMFVSFTLLGGHCQ